MLCKQKTIRLALAAGLVMTTYASWAEPISGTVKDANGEPVIGATVMEQGTQNGTVTDMDGNFTLDLQKGGNLNVSYVGMKPQVISTSGKSTINISLEDDATTLNDVVVVGYGTMKKKDLTGSVASVKMEDIGKVAGANVLQAIQAKIPGVDLQQSSGEAGGNVSINIRGNRSIVASNDPLIIVDGVEYGSTMDIPASEIESMDILKDAASTAIYGTKGANGVIIITTKRGVAGKKSATVNFNAYWSFNSPTEAVKSMYGSREVQRWTDRENYTKDLASGNWGESNVAVHDFGADKLPDNTLVNDLVANGDFMDWYDQILQNSTTQNYEIGVQGGTDKTNFNLSLALMSDRGLLKDDKMNRYNGRFNIDHAINNTFKVGGSFAFTYRDHDARNGGVFNAARKMTSLAHAYDVNDGSIIPNPNIYYTNHVNPLMDEGGNYVRNIESTRFLGSVYGQANIIKGMTFKSLFSVDRLNRRTGTYQDFNSVGRYQSPTTTALAYGTSASTKYTWQNTLNYNLSLNEKNDLGFLLGHEMFQTVSEGFDMSGTAGKNHFYGSTFYDQSKISAEPKWSSAYSKNAMLSFFGRVNYSYADKYLFQASLRADGSSVLAAGHKWSAFPSVSAGWRITEEKFMQSTKSWLDNLKLRLSWGISGNAAIDPYQTMATVYATTPSSATDFIPMFMSNSELSWERTSAFDAGLDFTFLNGRLGGSIDLYWSKTYDLLYYKTAPPSTVFTKVLSNIGDSKGHGVEIALNAVPVKTKDFQWDVNVSATFARDEITKLSDGLTIAPTEYGNVYHIVGEPISIFYDYEAGNCWGVGEWDKYVEDFKASHDGAAPSGTGQAGYGKPGTMKIIDQNGDGKIDSNDRKVYNRSPKAILGFNTSFTYKNLTLSMQMMARLGGYFAYDKNNALGLDDGDANWADVNYWTPTNTDTKFPSPGTNTTELKAVYTSYKTALLYEKANYFKIKDITLSYNFEKEWLKSLRMSNARVYCSLKNFITINALDDNYDPERGGSINFPLAKQFVLGLNVTF
ncbi:MAG: TonB-dependent receptor [Prevotella sp.]|nr:TonB-dependent receptor [Prevotella sp.]